MSKTHFSILFFLVILSNASVYSQTSEKFMGNAFPRHLIKEEIVKARELESTLDMLADECNWQRRIGKKIDVFWLRTEQGDFYGHVYEYFMDCDNLRLIYWYNDAQGKGELVDFMIEPLEDDSQFVSAKKKHLKNKKKYQIYLNR